MGGRPFGSGSGWWAAPATDLVGPSKRFDERRTLQNVRQRLAEVQPLDDPTSGWHHRRMAPTEFTPVARQSVSDTVLVQLREAILGGAYEPGDQLPPERELALAFAVNRHAVREAVKRLQ